MAYPAAHRLNPTQYSDLELHIQELVLEGFSPHDRYRIAQALERELSRLVTENGMPAAWSADKAQTSLDSGAFKVSQNSTPESIGAQVAQTVYGGSVK